LYYGARPARRRHKPERVKPVNRGGSVPCALINEGESFIVAAATEEMFEPGWNHSLMTFMFALDFLKDGFKRLQVGLWIPVTECMVGDYR